MRPLLAAALLALLLPAPAQAQISPGPLARAHQSLEGSTQCLTCHGSSREAMPRLCVGCHKEIAWLTQQRRGLHARTATAPGQSCGSCHPEHAGRDFDLIEWPGGSRDGFDHQQAGWILKGAHADAKCSSCHRTELRVGHAATLSPQERSAGWVGLETSCASCHANDTPHDEAVATACQECHDETAWAPAPAFDHAESRYPLTGRHRDSACSACHVPTTANDPLGRDGTLALRFGPLASGECSSCHRDPHRGALSDRCSSCHVTRGFDVIDSRGFNHGATRYALLGKHRSTSCEACHGRAMARPRPAFGRCDACHADTHDGEATATDGTPGDCAGCHTVSGFRPSTFALAQHDATPFPLGGAHRTVACAACHTRSSATAGTTDVVHLRLAVDGCGSCHAASHGDQLPGIACTDCHGEEAWSRLQYPTASHAGTRLPLEGRHAELDCARCHGPSRPGLPALQASVTTGPAGVVFRLAEVTCRACHVDPHEVSLQGAETTTCADCHTSTSFRPATVDIATHDTFRFPLEGAHRAVACIACHTGLSQSPRPRGEATLLAAAPHDSGSIVLGKVTGTTCAACHEGPHGEQFASRPRAGRCDACHDSETFAAAPRFDHDRDAAFALAGAHRDVPCARCHTEQPFGETAQVRYTPLPHRCEDCHAARPGAVGP